MSDLTMIVDLIAKLGGEGKEAFIWWLIMDKGLGALISIAIAGIAGYVVLHIVTLFQTNDLENLRDMMGIGSPGYVTAAEKASVYRWIQDHKNTTSR